MVRLKSLISFVLIMLATSFVVGLSVPSTATAVGAGKPISAWASFACPGHQTIAQRVDCTQGEWFWAEGVCPDGKTVRMVTQCPMASATNESLIRRIAGEEFAKRFRWGVGLGVNEMDVEDPGPAAPGVKGWFFGDLRVYEDWYFHFQIGPGVSAIRDTYPVTLTEFVGIQIPSAEQFSLTLGGRHEVAFLQKGELANALMGEAQMRVRMSDSLSFLVTGAYGHAWFPYKGPVDGFYPAGAKVPIEKKAGNEPTGSIGAGIELGF